MYSYLQEKPRIFTDDGQIQFLEIRDKKDKLLKIAGAARMDKLISGLSGDSWSMLACVDRLVEIGELKEITGNNVQGQDRVFVHNTK